MFVVNSMRWYACMDMLAVNHKQSNKSAFLKVLFHSSSLRPLTCIARSLIYRSFSLSDLTRMKLDYICWRGYFCLLCVTYETINYYLDYFALTKIVQSLKHLLWWPNLVWFLCRNLRYIKWIVPSCRKRNYASLHFVHSTIKCKLSFCFDFLSEGQEKGKLYIGKFCNT